MDAGRLSGASTTARIGAYRIQRLLGRGATATVYQCRHVALGRLVAIKVLHPHVACNPIALKRFVREGRALSRIVHPNVVEVFDVGDHEGVPYLVMSLVEGEDLGSYRQRQDPMSVAAIADCILPALSGITAAHEAGVVHRDLKPSNIRITKDRQGKPVPKVLDFGVSKLDGDDAEIELTQTEGVLGTVSYMAPEQLRSARSADARSDVYSLGVILYECATGRRPFRGESRYDVMHAILTAPVEPPSCARPDLPREFEEVILRAMDREASSRYGSVRELGSALAPFASCETTWLEGREPASRPHPLRGTESARSEMPSFTLTSESRPARRSRWRPLGVLAIAGAVFSWTTIVMLTSPNARHTGTASPTDAKRLGEGVPVAMAPSTLLTEPSPASSVATPSASSAQTTLPARPRRATPRRDLQALPRALPSASPVPDEQGANGAPILE